MQGMRPVLRQRRVTRSDRLAPAIMLQAALCATLAADRVHCAVMLT
jgi:hypothetical protein